MYVEWSEAELGKRPSVPCSYITNVDSRFWSRIIQQQPILKPLWHIYDSPFSLPTRHSQDAPLQPFPHSLDPSFSASVPLRYPSTTPTFESLRDVTQWNTSYSPLFVGKNHRVMSRLVDLAADPSVLRPLAYSRGSKIGFRVTQSCPQNQPLDQGNTTGAVEPAPWTLSAYGRTSACMRQILSKRLQVGLLDLPAGWLTP